MRIPGFSVNPTRRGELAIGPLMVIPAAAGLGVFWIWPLIVAIMNSFRGFNPFTHRPTGWAGFANYQQILADPAFQSAFWISLVYMVLMIVVIVPLALVLAILLDKRMPGTVLARAAILAALASSEAVAALMWNQLYQPSSGLFDAIFRALGMPTQPFLTDGNLAIVAIVIMTAWKDVGLPMLIFLGGLQAIPPHLFEAASMDGANRWRKFWRITLPLMRPSIVLSLFMTTIAAARLFTPIQILTSGGPNGQTSNLAYFSYAQAFLFNSPGQAAASVVVMLLMLVVITVIQGLALRGKRGAS
ncbi:carbohydrate ABC transporter permease [Devosia sp. A16]|uniref:carbohydrate ABC transporter permease n=1 Tax=Devosia sp. A16 TaxID=1736675 RepID=UPI000AC33946|nr:sugar ABC transporter permease [Devosia sp. A16]